MTITKRISQVTIVGYNIGYSHERSGGNEAQAFSELFRYKGKEAKNIAELGIGANEKAIASGSPLEHENVTGTVQVAIGDTNAIGVAL